MTELNDHLKLLFARSARLFDKETAQPVQHDNADSIFATLQQRIQSRHEVADWRLVVTFPVELPANTTPDEVAQWLSASGFTRIHQQRTMRVADLPSAQEAATATAKRSQRKRSQKSRTEERR